ncbi:MULTISPECIES: hypothetical protein [unclassified Alteromonas]|uniref:hypothetical protein n=1 Tax=unclassified Alteromonas TaxID=2614992 RepID=UPI000509C8AA|nr:MULTISPECIES: hypothetical protein [unclassified Alteromonas]
MLKNWIVKTTQIKNKETGFIAHVNYLIDEKRPSHHYTNISVLVNNADAIVSAVDERQKNRKLKGLRGGGVRNYCTSFILTVPRDIKQPNKKDWQKIIQLTLSKIASETGLDIKLIFKHCVAVLHDESKSTDKSSHVHLLVSNVISNEFQKSITQKAVTLAVKNALNEGVLKTVGENNIDYTPKRKQRYNKPSWAFRQERNEEIEKKLKALKSAYRSVISSIKDWTNHYLTSLIKQSESKANDVSNKLDHIGTLSANAEFAFDPTIKMIESQNLSMPEKTKVTPKRKRKRRKR